MTSQAWDLLVRRLETTAKQKPSGYRLRVAGLAALGYLYLGVVLLVLGAVVVGSGALVASGHPAALKALIPAAVLGFIVVRALPVKLTAPEGVELERDHAPDLFALIDDLRRETGAPRLHRVLVDPHFNASVVQLPRFGLFGPSRNYLVLGLPLMQALAPAELAAVVAHELGHVSARHGRFSAWVYRVRVSWARLLESLESKGHWGSGLFRRFFRWYAPYFSAYSFVLAREQEYEADRAAADAAGAEEAASALARIGVTARYLDESWWPEFYEQAERSATPTTTPFAALGHAFTTPIEVDAGARFTQAALSEETGTADTHPSLRHRLEALGFVPETVLESVREPVADPAAQHYLGALYPRLVEHFDGEWAGEVGTWWQGRYDDAQAAAQRLEALDADRDDLDGEELLEYASLVERFRDSESARPHYALLVERFPDSAAANFGLGRVLLDVGDDSGLGHLERAMRADADAILPACELAVAFLLERGRGDEARYYFDRARMRHETLAEAGEERSALRRDEDLREHGLPSAAVAELAGQLSAFPEVERAYLGRRCLEHLDDEFPSFVLGVELRIPRLRPHVGDPKPELVRRLAAELSAPIDLFVVDLGAEGKLRKRLHKVDAAQIYAR